MHLDPHSEEYYQKLVEALELDTHFNSHVNPDILTQFKALIRKYPTAFHLPGAELHPVKGFHHDISTGDSLQFTICHTTKAPRNSQPLKRN